MAFILNRRAKLRASAIPVEIPDASTIVKKTDKASASKLGLVKIGDNVNISSAGAISVSDASSETKGVVKLGTGLSVNAETGAVYVPDASSETKGLLKLGTGLSVNPVTGAVDVAGGGMTWTKIYDDTTTQGGTMDFVQGTNAFDHKFMIIETLSGADGAGFAFVGLEVLPDNTTSIRVSLQRYDDAPVLTITPTTFSQPNTMGASRAIIYVLD